MKTGDLGNDKVDTVELDVPLLMRILEYAREDAHDDIALHDVAEAMIAMSKMGTLTMDNYEDIVGSEPMDNEVQDQELEESRPTNILGFIGGLRKHPDVEKIVNIVSNYDGMSGLIRTTDGNAYEIDVRPAEYNTHPGNDMYTKKTKSINAGSDSQFDSWAAKVEEEITNESLSDLMNSAKEFIKRKGKRWAQQAEKAFWWDGQLGPREMQEQIKDMSDQDLARWVAHSENQGPNAQNDFQTRLMKRELMRRYRISPNGNMLSMDEGYSILPPIDRERYGNREQEGLEGPFVMRNGKVLYYDKHEGKYYDPDTDMFVSDEDYFAMDKGTNEGTIMNEESSHRFLESIGGSFDSFMQTLKTADKEDLMHMKKSLQELMMVGSLGSDIDRLINKMMPLVNQKLATLSKESGQQQQDDDLSYMRKLAGL